MSLSYTCKRQGTYNRPVNLHNPSYSYNVESKVTTSHTPGSFVAVTATTGHMDNWSHGQLVTLTLTTCHIDNWSHGQLV